MEVSRKRKRCEIEGDIARMNREEVGYVSGLCRARLAMLSSERINNTLVGELVKFKGKKGYMVTGEVVKVNIKNLVVLDKHTMTKWNVSAHLCTPVAREEQPLITSTG